MEAGEKLSGPRVRKIQNLAFTEMYCGAFSDLEMSSYIESLSWQIKQKILDAFKQSLLL